MSPDLTVDKQQLSERDICTKFITPALRQAGWDELSQLREEVSFTKGRIIVRGQMVKRGKAKRADYILYYKPNIPLAVIEAKDNHCSVGDGLQQALECADTLLRTGKCGLLVEHCYRPATYIAQRQEIGVHGEQVTAGCPSRGTDP